ncbi:hypothetical protein KGM_207829A, partial [Danaus plexippus plexippus]
MIQKELYKQITVSKRLKIS